MDTLHERVGGLDVHKATVAACVRIMADGQVTRECRSFETTTSGLLVLLQWLRECRCTHVAMEATGVYWKPVWSVLSDGDFELLVVNAAHIKNVSGRKTDMNDAMWIADLTACGLDDNQIDQFERQFTGRWMVVEYLRHYGWQEQRRR